MNNKILLLTLVLFANVAYGARPKIVTSITPIASIISMMTENAAEIVAIDMSAGCPHHYQMRPSDKDKVINAKMLVYIDDSFDGFAGRLFTKFKGKTVKLSELKSINFVDDSGKKNWHFWLDLQNILALHNELSDILLKEFPELEYSIISSQNKIKAKITSLMQLKNNELKSIGELVVLSDSLAHFFIDVDTKITKLYQKSNSSLKDLEKLEYALNSDLPQCIVIDSSQDPEAYRKFNKKIIQLDSENWSLENDMSGSWDLFCNKYLKMINQLQGCR